MSSPNHLTVTELAHLRTAEPATRVLDVRTPGEFAAAHIPGSYNVPVDDLGAVGRQIAAVSDPVVLVCQSGGRARRAETALAAAGMANVRVLDGGLAAWMEAGGELNRGKAGWSIERQVRLVAGGIVAAGVAGSVVFPPLKWLAGAVGAGLVTAASTDSCVMGTLLAKLPHNRGAGCDLEAVVARLQAGATGAGPAPAADSGRHLVGV